MPACTAGYWATCDSVNQLLVTINKNFLVYELDLGFNFPVKVFELHVYCKDIYLQPCHWCLIYIYIVSH